MILKNVKGTMQVKNSSTRGAVEAAIEKAKSDRSRPWVETSYDSEHSVTKWVEWTESRERCHG